MTAVSETLQLALDARQRMLDQRPDARIPALPAGRGEGAGNCAQYFQTAGFLYSMAAEAYSTGDENNGLLYELWAYQHLLIGQACEAET